MTNSLTRGADAPRQVVYVALGGEKHLLVLDLDATTGKLSPRGKVEIAGSPGPLAFDAKAMTIFAGLRSPGAVQTIGLQQDGSLTLGAVTPINLNPVYLAVDGAGKHVLAADYGSGIVVVHEIDERHAVIAQPTFRELVGKNPHSVYLNGGDRFVYVPVLGDDGVLQFRFDPATGKLTPNDPPKVNAQPGDGPRHMAWHASGKFAFVADELSSTLTSCRLDSDKGTLTVVQRVSTLPADFAIKKTSPNSVADVHATRDGKFVYVSNRGHDSIAAFRTDGETGALTLIGHFKTEATPRAFALDVSENFVMVAGQSSGKLATYRVDHATGKLQALEVIEVGKGPCWVLAVGIGGN